MSEPTLKVVRTVWDVMVTPKTAGTIGWPEKVGPKYGTSSAGTFNSEYAAKAFQSGLEFALQWCPVAHRPECKIVSSLVEDTSKKITDFI
jgi:hypothetical protein